jgi:hypothetical protein
MLASLLLRMPWLKTAGYIAIGIALLMVAIYVASIRVALGIAQGDLAKAKGTIASLELANKDLISKNNDWRLAFDKIQKISAKCTLAVENLELATQKAKNNALEAIKRNADILAHREDQIKRASDRPANPGGNCEAAILDAKADLRGKL